MPEVLLPLTDALEWRHAPVVITEIDNPVPLVEHLLQPLGGLQILLGLLAGQSQNFSKLTAAHICTFIEKVMERSIFTK